MNDGSRVGLVLAAAFGAAAVTSAFLPLWFADHGLSAAEIGLVLGLSSIMKVVAVPGGGWLADRLGRRPVLLLAMATAGAAASALPSLHGLAAFLVAVALLGAAGSLIAPLMDALTLALAGLRRLEYGRTRAWGSIAYMLATAGAGWLLARTGSGVVPGLLVVGFGLAAVAGLFLPDAPAPLRMPGSAEAPLRSPVFRLTLLATMLIQGSHAAYYSFAPLHWRAAGIGDFTIGLLIAEGIIAEVALFLWGRGLVERLGPAGLTALAAAACIVRWSVMAFTVDVRVLAVVQLLHAATFACQHLSSMRLLARLPPGRAAMAQTVLASLGFSLPTGLLVWLTGRLYGGWGGLVFLLMALAGGLALLTVRPMRRALGRPMARVPG